MASPLYLSILIGQMVVAPAPKPLIDALRSAEVTVATTGRSGFSLVFSLGQSSVLQTLFMLSGGLPISLLRVVLVATLGGLPQAIFDGIIKHHEVTPNVENGTSTLTVLGDDLTTVMDLIDGSGTPFPGMTPELQVQTILAKYAVFGVIPVIIPSYAPDVTTPTDRIPAQVGTDLAYIRKLARDAGYTFYVDPGPAPGTSIAYWGPENRLGVPQPALNINMDAWTNVETLSFRYAPQTAVTPVVFIQQPISKLTIPIVIPPIDPLKPPMGALIPLAQNVEYLNDTAKLTVPQALMKGLSRQSQTADVVSGDGTLDVLRYGHILRARGVVGVRGAGVAYDGLHYVDSVTHTIKPGSYKQKFNLKRNGLVSTVPLVPTESLI